MEEKIKYFLNKQNIKLDKEKYIICAVSGGVDSIALLHILYNLSFKVVLAHVNHHLREESDIEEREMKNLAKNLNIPYEQYDFYHNKDENFEGQAHDERYDFFKSCALKYNTNIIATAHHQDDQIESVLIKILQGSNLYGYGGIKIANFDNKFIIIRPLLCVNKDEIYDYVNKNNYIYFEDKTNLSDDYLRNRIRHHITPLLKKESNINEKIMEYSIQIHEAFEFIRKLSISYLKENDNKIKYNTFKKLDKALKKDIISLLLEQYKIKKTYDLINDIYHFLNDNKGNKKYSLGNNYIFYRSYDVAYIKKEIKSEYSEIKIIEDKKIIFQNRYKILLTKKILFNVKCLRLCYNNLRMPLLVRNRKKGDEINLLSGTKKIARIFIDNKINISKRDEIPIFSMNNNEILWVFDYAKSKNCFEQKDNADIYLYCEEINE